MKDEHYFRRLDQGFGAAMREDAQARKRPVPTPARIELTDSVLSAIRKVCDYIGADIPRGTPATEWAEMAIDAGRLVSIANAKDAQDEVTRLIKEHGYLPVLREIAKHTNYE